MIRALPGKPPYRVPLMSEIRETPWNGLTVVSTFSGCGGSSLGFRMAGYRVLWSNEFVPAARESYRANAAPATHIDARDIRVVAPDDILRTIGRARGEIDILEGSPPCAAFSTAGSRAESWNKQRKYSGTVQRTDDLFWEFARLLEGLQPRVFVAENVSGLVKGVAKGYFLDILKTLKRAGYRVEAKVLDAQWLGVPQARARLIFVGVREDLHVKPAFPRPLRYRYALRDALPWLVMVKGGNSAAYESKRKGVPLDKPCPTLMSTGGQFRVEAESDISRYEIGKEWLKLSLGGQSERYFQLIRPSIGKPCPTITAEGGNPSLASVTYPTEQRKFSIAELRRICSFPDDFVLTGSYQQQWERLGRAVPPLMMQAIAATLRDDIFARLDKQRAA